MVIRTIGNFEIVRPLSSSGIGEVYQGRETNSQRKVVLKKFSPQGHHVNDPLTLLERELDTIASLKHPNIGSVYAIHPMDQSNYLVRDWVKGKPINTQIPSQGWPLATLLKVAIPLCEALYEAHGRGISHLDLKPSNLFLDKDDVVKIVDFKSHHIADQQESISEILEGPDPNKTHPYMSPEALKGDPLSMRTDVYALGVLLYHMATGRLPFAGSGEALRNTILHNSPKSLHSINPELPGTLDYLVRRCLSKDPANRPQHAGKVLKSLTSIAKQAESLENAAHSAFNPYEAYDPKFSFIVPTSLLLVVVVLIAFAFEDSNHPSSQITINSPKPNLSAATDSSVIITHATAASPVKLNLLPFVTSGYQDDHTEQLIEGFYTVLNQNLAGIDQLALIKTQPGNRIQKASFRAGNTTVDSGYASPLNPEFTLKTNFEILKNRDSATSLIVTLQLIRSQDYQEIWSESFEGTTDDFVIIKQTITNRLINFLNIQLTEDEQSYLNQENTVHPSAYQAYLKAVAILPWGFGLDERYLKAEKLLNHAVTIDPDFTLAWCKLVDTHLGLYWFGNDPTRERFERAYDAVQSALTTNPSSLAAKAALANYYYHVRNYKAALRVYSELFQYRPNDLDILKKVGFLYRRSGKIYQAVKNFDRALAMNPTDHELKVETSYTMSILGHYDRAIQLNTEVLEHEPNNDLAPFAISMAYLLRDFEGDVELARNYISLYENPDSSYPAEYRIVCEIFAGNYEAARNIISRLKEPKASTQIIYHPADLYLALAALGEGNHALAKDHFAAAVDVLTQFVEEHPEDFRALGALGVAHAGLGNKELAIKHGKRALALMYPAKDSIRGPRRIYDLVRIYSLLGETDLALEHIEQLVAVPNEVGGAYLTHAPELANVRKDPRFWNISKGYHTPNRF